MHGLHFSDFLPALQILRSQLSPRAIVRRYRDEFLTAVFHVVQGNIAYFGGEATALSSEDIFVEDVSVEELDRIEDALADLTSQSTIARVASRIAALYYMASYSPELHREGDRWVESSPACLTWTPIIHRRQEDLFFSCKVSHFCLSAGLSSSAFHGWSHQT